MVHLASAAVALMYSFGAIRGTTATSLSTFSDAECKKSLQELEAQDGFPDGVCTNFRQQATRQPYQSFMFNRVDFGCSGTLPQFTITFITGFTSVR